MRTPIKNRRELLSYPVVFYNPNYIYTFVAVLCTNHILYDICKAVFSVLFMENYSINLNRVHLDTSGNALFFSDIVIVYIPECKHS